MELRRLGRRLHLRCGLLIFLYVVFRTFTSKDARREQLLGRGRDDLGMDRRLAAAGRTPSRCSRASAEPTDRVHDAILTTRH